MNQHKSKAIRGESNPLFNAHRGGLWSCGRDSENAPAGIRRPCLEGRSIPLKQFRVNNLAYQSRVAQIPIRLIMYSNQPPREKEVSLPKNCGFKAPGFMIFTSQPCLFKGAWDLVGAPFYKCKYNYYLCISGHPKTVKDNTVALAITIPSFSSPAELQMLLH